MEQTKPDLIDSLLRQVAAALERVIAKSTPLSSELSVSAEERRDRLDVICMQCLAIGEAIKWLDRMSQGTLFSPFPSVDWKGAMGFQDVIAHQYFDLDEELVLLICEQSIPRVYEAILQIQRDRSALTE
ncbi:DUF86 domain-containing protein [Synechococcus elongatus]|uniref:HepT-like ribonuclease domain-containing protein n=1 Tax=Synechococcus elongatus TaxID=32046 RepID=UPI000F7E7B21|nr:HepT-like ribonuclease domain-containing protein [Synechococcus elongatus]